MRIIFHEENNGIERSVYLALSNVVTTKLVNIGNDEIANDVGDAIEYTILRL